MSTELIVLEDVKIEPFFIGGKGIDSILAEIESKAMEHVPDVSTDKGRKAIKANVTKIVTCKTFLEASGKDLSAKRKLEPKLIDANRKRVKEFLEALQLTARLKLTEWEAEQARIKLEAEEKAAAEKLQAEVDHDHEMAILMMAEDFRQRAEAEEKTRLAQIARDDAIALKAKKLAEDEAQDAIDKAETDKQAAIDAAKKAEVKAKQDAIDYLSREKMIAIDADNAKVKAKQKAKRDAEQAVIDEQKRVAADKKRIDDETAKREANTAHKGKVNREAMAAIMKCGIDEDLAVKVIKAIHKGLIPNVSISY